MVEPSQSPTSQELPPNHHTSSGAVDDDTQLLYENSRDFADNGNKHHNDSLQEESNLTAAATVKLG